MFPDAITCHSVRHPRMQKTALRVTRAGRLAYSASSTHVKSAFENMLIEVWRQTLVESATVIELGNERYPVRQTSKRKLRQVDFVFDGTEIRGLEQNPQTKSEWAQLARSGKKVMQFLIEGRYVANVVDGKATLYGGGG